MAAMMGKAEKTKRPTIQGDTKTNPQRASLPSIVRCLDLRDDPGIAIRFRSFMSPSPSPLPFAETA
jgi:hypothetical protein